MLVFRSQLPFLLAINGVRAVIHSYHIQIRRRH